MQGNNRTTPSGIDILELPLNLSGRRKNAHLEVVLALVLTSSIEGRLGDVGIRLMTLCTNSIDEAACVVRWATSRDRGNRFPESSTRCAGTR